MEEKQKQSFKLWLKENTVIGDDTIGDIISRVCRIEKMLSLNENLPAEDFLFKLSKKPQFSSLTATVKSQLRRAYKLYYKFRH